MAIATNGGHIARAIDFYNTEGKYFIIGGTTPWDDETLPDSPTVNDFRLRDVVGLKRVDNTHLVIPTTETENVISYRNQNWKVVDAISIATTISNTSVTAGSTTLSVASIVGLTVGSKIRIANIYEGKILSITGLTLTLDTSAPQDIPLGSEVLGGAVIEGAKYVYVDCYLDYNEFPIVNYRQIGLCTGVTPRAEDILLHPDYIRGDYSSYPSYSSLGTLEILDNRVNSQRDISQRELLSLIVEF